jgi:Ca2+-binding RTX toxin-like protein
VITGNSVNNTLSGGTGTDTLIAGAGNDIYVVDNVGDVVTEIASEGTDTVQSSVTYTLSANVENLTLTGTTAINGTGNNLDNVLTGNSAINTLTGGAGNDTLDGGTGADKLLGGAGDDTYLVDNTGDLVTENASEGADMVKSSIAYSLGNNVENLTLTGTTAINGTGNTLNNQIIGNSAINTLTGGAGNDTLDGGTGADRLLGGSGDDTYIVDNTGDVVTENTSEGADTVKSSITYTLGNNVENLILTGTTAVNGTGNTLSNLITGNSATNTLSGGAGNDTLDGSAGNDSLTGGVGNDTYILGRGYGSDTITENDTTSGNSDVAQFSSGITSDQLWFQHIGNNLAVSIIGTADKFNIQNWYSGSAYHVEQFKTSDGKVLLDTQVDTLVNAMAAFSPPVSGQTTLPQNYQDSLTPVLAANWH